MELLCECRLTDVVPSSKLLVGGIFFGGGNDVHDVHDVICTLDRVH